MSAEEDFDWTDDKKANLTKRELIIRRQLGKEIAKMKEMSAKDREFKELAETEDLETKAMTGEYVDQEENKIVGA